MAQGTVSRDLLESILTKLGAKFDEKMSAERMAKKIAHRVKTNGAPEGLTDDETAYLADAGLIGVEDQSGDSGDASEDCQQPEDAEGGETKQRRKPTSGGKGAGEFREIFESKKAIPKSEVIDRLVKTGVSDASARAYVVWAKRKLPGASVKNPSPAKGQNPWGFRIEESKTADGKKMLKRV